MNSFSFKSIGLLSFLFLLVPVFAWAGSITPAGEAYAWSSKLGWVNFAPTNGNVSVTDSALTGYAWSTEAGWINLAPSQSGVKNTLQGVLSGSAWGSNTGWINFSGVTVSPTTGVFSGQATGDIVGTLNFSCDHCRVVTTWRPSSSVTPVTTLTRGGGGSGVLPVKVEPVPLAKITPTILTRTLYYGVTHNQVKLLQKFLNAHGFFVAKKGAGSPGKETFFFGLATKQAVMKFQKANKIKPVSGLVGPLTRKAIEKLSK